MKRLVFIICILFMASGFGYSQAPTQRLFIPQGTFFNSGSNSINLASYCMDAFLAPPALQGQDVFFYGNILNTMLSFIENGNRRKTIPLIEAYKKYVDIDGSMINIRISPINNNIKLISLQSNGFVVSVYNFDRTETEKLLQYLLNKKLKQRPNSLEDYLKNQDLSWRIMTRINKANTLKDAGKKLHEKHPDWVITTDNNRIKITEKRTDGNTHSKKGSLLNDLSAEGNETTGCLNFNSDSGFTSISLSTKIHGVPVTIEFSTENAIKISTKLEGTFMKNKVKYNKYSLKVEHAIDLYNSSGDNDEESCKPQASLELCWPPKESSISFEICGKKITGGIKQVSLGF